MKKIILAGALLGFSMSASAAAPGGSDCGWGNMLFAGNSGLPAHTLASIVNATSGNATFGMTSGTNGCDTSGTLTYGGKSLLSMNGVLEEVAHDVAMGEGEALTALSIAMGVPTEDRARFNAVLHENFASIFPTEDATAEEVHNNIVAVLQKDDKLAQYSA